MVCAAHLHGARRRHHAVWCRLYGALLHHVLALAAPVLLPLRISCPGFGDPPRHLRGDLDHADLLPAHGGEPQVVVAVVPGQRRFGDVRLPVLHVLLHEQADDQQGGPYTALLRLHGHRVGVVLPPDWLNWRHRVVPLREGHLRLHQGGLTGQCGTAREVRLPGANCWMQGCCACPAAARTRRSSKLAEDAMWSTTAQSTSRCRSSRATTSSRWTQTSTMRGTGWNRHQWAHAGATGATPRTATGTWRSTARRSSAGRETASVERLGPS
mmetsp:Transcript_102249/g.289581  ORF Transcript_102249/g.289581 Transcript_102249/m.289581 type:complete len:269 (+) Transcript_102249:1482-2288(+)